MRSYGGQRQRDYIRKQVKLAEEFYQMLSVDDRFEFPVPPAIRVLFASDKASDSRYNSYNTYKILHLMDFFIL